MQTQKAGDGLVVAQLFFYRLLDNKIIGYMYICTICMCVSPVGKHYAGFLYSSIPSLKNIGPGLPQLGSKMRENKVNLYQRLDF